MNNVLLQTLNAEPTQQHLPNKAMMALQQTGSVNSGVSPSMSFLMGDPVVRDARLRLDNKKSFSDDHMFFPEHTDGMPLMAGGAHPNLYLPVGVNSYGLNTYNQRVSQHSTLNAHMELGDPSMNGLAGPVPLTNRGVYTGQSFSSAEGRKQQSQQTQQPPQQQQHVNPYLLSTNVQQSFSMKDGQQQFYGRGSKVNNTIAKEAGVTGFNPNGSNNEW